MQLILFDREDLRSQLFPLTLTRPVANLRVGILTIVEKWEKYLRAPASYLTAAYLQYKYPLSINEGVEDIMMIDGGLCPDESLCNAITGLKQGERLTYQDSTLAIRVNRSDFRREICSDLSSYRPILYDRKPKAIRFPEQIFLYNGDEIRSDFELITAGRSSYRLDSSNHIIGDALFVEEGASAICATINTLTGPVYLAKNSELWEGSLVRGSFSLGEDSQVKMGTKIYSNVSVGPGCRVGGELNTSVIWGNTSKGHEGYLGSSVVGEWCNWGADSNNSNLKNNYKPVRLYDYKTNGMRNTGLQFCGTIMGDHVKCAINTAFNTGSVIGVSANIFGASQLRQYVPEFAWGNDGIAGSYELQKMFDTAKLVFERRNRTFDTIEQELLTHVYRFAQGKQP